MGLEHLAHASTPEQLHDLVDPVEQLSRGEDAVLVAKRRFARGNGLSPQIAHISIYILS